jgi:hypothetical protein
MERNVDFAHTRIDALEKEVVAIKTEVRIQFKDLFIRVQAARGYPDWRV